MVTVERMSQKGRVGKRGVYQVDVHSRNHSTPNLLLFSNDVRQGGLCVFFMASALWVCSRPIIYPLLETLLGGGRNAPKYGSPIHAVAFCGLGLAVYVLAMVSTHFPESRTVSLSPPPLSVDRPAWPVFAHVGKQASVPIVSMVSRPAGKVWFGLVRWKRSFVFFGAELPIVALRLLLPRCVRSFCFWGPWCEIADRGGEGVLR